jgi:hypothetical protein
MNAKAACAAYYAAEAAGLASSQAVAEAGCAAARVVEQRSSNLETSALDTYHKRGITYS